MSDRVTELFARVFKLPATDLSDDSNPDSVKEWDSLKAMELVAEIEETFDVQLSTVEIMKMNSIGRAREVLRRKGVKDV